MTMAGTAMGMKTPSSSTCIRQNINNKNDIKNRRYSFISATISSADPYHTLRICPHASEYDVKKAFRRLALQYHPDVCRGDNCRVQFQQINEAYNIVLSTLRGETTKKEMKDYYEEDEQFIGMKEESEWELWEEWMGWEGAGIRDYSSHINPYI